MEKVLEQERSMLTAALTGGGGVGGVVSDGVDGDTSQQILQDQVHVCVLEEGGGVGICLYFSMHCTCTFYPGLLILSLVHSFYP